MSSHRVTLCGQELERPGHICAFFDSRAAEYATLIPFLKEGMDRGEEVVSVIDRSRREDHEVRLNAGGIGPGDRLRLAASEDTYLAGGHFDMERMVGFVRAELESAARRHRCVRTAGWMDWLQPGIPGAERAIEYEARMNFLFEEFDATFVCIYDLSQLGGKTVVDIMATHPWVILNGEIRENSFYVPPEQYLKELQAQKTA